MVYRAKQPPDAADEQRQKSVDNAETEEADVNLTIKVRRLQRLHWLIEAKKQGTSLTAAITAALNERFGTPG